jgi:DNA-binding CsgD family transcriptional regulator
MQVVRAATSGKTNKAIASELHLSEHTVKNYLFRAFEKLGVFNRVELPFYLSTRERPVEQRKKQLANDTTVFFRGEQGFLHETVRPHLGISGGVLGSPLP